MHVQQSYFNVICLTKFVDKFIKSALEVILGSYNFHGHCLSVLRSKVGGSSKQKGQACPSLWQQFNFFKSTCVKDNSQEHSISLQPHLLSKNYWVSYKIKSKVDSAACKRQNWLFIMLTY